MKPDAIFIKLQGGLGNQMFQYALGRRLSVERGVPLQMDLGALEKDIQREYALGNFGVDEKIASTDDIAKLLPWPRRLPRKLSWLPRLPGKVRLVVEREFTFDESVLSVPDAVYLDGYWQSERYFASIADQVRADFQLVHPLSDLRQEIATNIAGRTAISVHVRRGDYVSNPVAQAYHGTCSPQWYEQSMSALAAAIENPTFFIFSDDSSWARANLPDKWDCHFIEPQSDRRDCEDMHLMALCDHHIIANSSFSWWGAWLNPSDSKKVIAPLDWFNEAPHDTRDLIPNGWMQL